MNKMASEPFITLSLKCIVTSGIHLDKPCNRGVALFGPRQEGKTTLTFALAEDRESIYLDLESDADLNKLEFQGNST